MLPDSINDQIQSGLDTEIVDFRSVYGGDINQAGKISVSSGEQWFVKWNRSAPKDMFHKEAKGLGLLNSAGTKLEIPEVILAGDEFLVTTFIEEGGGKAGSAHDFGIELAKLHRKTNDTFGLDHDNYIGRLPQSNTEHTNWPDFFAIERIEAQVKMGVESGKLNRGVLKTVQSLYKKLGAIFPAEQPALIHGDLWGGNYMFTRSGMASIYDPAVYYGHREMEIAMTRLFGGYSADFYRGYNEEFPLEKNYEDRITLCNLYPILVHANLFGGSYCRQAENIIQQYA